MVPPNRLANDDRCELFYDSHGGFTIETKVGTLWRPASALGSRGRPVAKLFAYAEHSFYQNNNDVTKAFYKVAGYRYILVAWFDNITGKRIA